MRSTWCERAHILWASVTINRDEQHNELINVGKLEKRQVYHVASSTLLPTSPTNVIYIIRYDTLAMLQCDRHSNSVAAAFLDLAVYAY